MDDYKSPAYGSQGELHAAVLPEVKKIEEYKLFATADYTVLDYPIQMRESIQNICNFLVPKYWNKEVLIMGIGTSGAMMMALLQHYMMNNHGRDAVKLKFYIMRKPGENAHGIWFNRDHAELPIILIDDHVAGGNTMLGLSSLIREKIGYYALLNVVGIAAENSQRLVHNIDIEKYYPNLEFVLY